MNVQCPTCRCSATVPDSAAGKTIKCSCGAMFVVAQPDVSGIDINPRAREIRAQAEREQALQAEVKRKVLMVLTAPIWIVTAGVEKIRSARADNAPTPARQSQWQHPDRAGSTFDSLLSAFSFLTKAAVVLLVLGLIGGGLYYYKKTSDEDATRHQRAEQGRLEKQREEQAIKEEERRAEAERQRIAKDEAAAEQRRLAEERRRQEAELRAAKIEADNQAQAAAANERKRQPSECPSCSGTGKKIAYKQMWPTDYPGPNTARAKCNELNNDLMNARANINSGFNSGSRVGVLTREEQWQVFENANGRYVIVRGYSEGVCPRCNGARTVPPAGE